MKRVDKETFKAFCQNYVKPDGVFQLPWVMGIVNRTPDSFSDGGKYTTLSKAFDKAMLLVAEGADLLDIGGESSRPGAKTISIEEELDRVLPLVEKLRKETATCLSIDTTKPQLMFEAAALGVGLINDVNALQADGALELVSTLDLPVCLMHRQGNSETMQEAPFYPNGVPETINDFFSDRIRACLEAKMAEGLIILDPGFGMGKTVSHNLTLVREFEVFFKWGRPLMLGFSRKQTIGEILNKAVGERVIGGLVLTVTAAMKGVSIIRTHEVDATRQALIMLQNISGKGKYND